jgi:hypothetical protein
LITDTFSEAADRSELAHSETGEALLETEIYIVGLAEGVITFRGDTNDNIADGITIWSGFGDDVIEINGTHYRDGLRTITTLNTGLGDDTVTVDLDTPGDDGFFVLNTQGPYNEFLAISDNDTVIAAADAINNVPPSEQRSLRAFAVDTFLRVRNVGVHEGDEPAPVAE